MFPDLVTEPTCVVWNSFPDVCKLLAELWLSLLKTVNSNTALSICAQCCRRVCLNYIDCLIDRLRVYIETPLAVAQAIWPVQMLGARSERHLFCCVHCSNSCHAVLFKASVMAEAVLQCAWRVCEQNKQALVIINTCSMASLSGSNASLTVQSLSRPCAIPLAKRDHLPGRALCQYLELLAFCRCAHACSACYCLTNSRSSSEQRRLPA